MINTSALACLGQLYPAGSLNDPVYALAGGTAVQCRLQNSVNCRVHHDIDLFAFKPGFLRSILGNIPNIGQASFFLGSFSQAGIVTYSPTAPVQIQICRGSYFDSEITPTIADVRLVDVDNISILALSSEFIVTSKLSYPNVHRSCDFQDVLTLNSVCSQNLEYLSALLMKTSLGELIKAQDILDLRTQADLQALVDSIHRQLIKRFLHWDRVNVDALNPAQLFVLLDVKDRLFNLPSEVCQFVDTMLIRIRLNGRKLQLAKLGLHFLAMGIPIHTLEVLRNSDFQALIYRWLALVPNQPTFWLSKSKNIFTTFQYLTFLEELIGQQFVSIWSQDVFIKIVQRILFDDLSRFTLLSSLKSLYHDIKTGQVSVIECVDLLHNVL